MVKKSVSCVTFIISYPIANVTYSTGLTQITQCRYLPEERGSSSTSQTQDPHFATVA